MEYRICQSCGMPLHKPGIQGTGADGMPVEDYCVHCFRDGQFTEDVTMEEMIRLCADYVDGNSRAFSMAGMKMLYPRLKRWARKEDTQNEYYKSISRVLKYIQANLDQPSDLKTLSGIARISPYHFHRIFKATIGESLAEYVQRLRLEYVAGQLQTTALSLGELALQTGYSSEQALSRAFKKYFYLPPKTFKASFFRDKFRDALVPRICTVAAKPVIVLGGPVSEAVNWQKLYTYALVNGLLAEGPESLEVIRDGHFLPALTTREVRKENKHTEPLVLTEGLYAIFTHKGDPEGVRELYTAIFNYWLPAGKYALGNTLSYLVYLNHPASVAPENLLTEIYIPLTEKKKQG